MAQFSVITVFTVFGAGGHVLSLGRLWGLVCANRASYGIKRFLVIEEYLIVVVAQ